jgi:hypothetical protein
MTTYAPTVLGDTAKQRATGDQTPFLYRAYSLLYGALAVLVLAFLALVPVVAA